MNIKRKGNGRPSLEPQKENKEKLNSGGGCVLNWMKEKGVKLPPAPTGERVETKSKTKKEVSSKGNNRTI